MRFLLSRRWLAFAVVVGLLTWLAVELGDWQFRRLDERQAGNARLERNLAAPSRPVADVLAPGRPARTADEWRLVTATGEYDDARTVVVRYRTRDGQPGVDVVTPLRTGDGTAVLVDRGWMSAPNSAERPAVPEATAGRVTVTGYVRVDGTGESTRVNDLTTRAVSSATIGRVVPYPLYGGFLELHEQSPGARPALAAVELPEVSNGPHFFYGLQWWFFGAIAVVGFCYLVYDERRRLRAAPPRDDPSGPDPPEPDVETGSEGPEHAAVDRQHRAGHER